MTVSDSIRRILNWIKRDGEPIDIQAILTQQTAAGRDIEELENQVRELEHQVEDLKEDNAKLENHLETVATAIDRDVPSITKQTPWRCQFYNFGPAKKYGYRFFNLAIINRTDGDWLLVRRARPMPGTVDGMNDLMAFKIDADKNIQRSYEIRFPKRYPNEHFEDPRIIWLNGEMLLSASTFHRLGERRWALVHQIAARLNNDWSVARVFDPIYGTNGGSPLMQTGFEKNWLWFEHDHRPHMVYCNQPHEVVEFNELLKAGKVHKTRYGNPLWKHGEIRGGTPPLLVGNEYFSFFHSSTPWIGKKRRYHMGCYAFEAHPPFRITRMSTLPILSGSKDDPWFDGLPLVVFPCGAIIRNGIWTVTLGVNDCESAWIEIPHNELTETLRATTEIEDEKVPEVVNATVRDLPVVEGSRSRSTGQGKAQGGGKPEAIPVGDEDFSVTNV